MLIFYFSIAPAFLISTFSTFFTSLLIEKTNFYYIKEGFLIELEFLLRLIIYLIKPSSLSLLISINLESFLSIISTSQNLSAYT
jgi:hypothetical protein